MGTSTWLKRDKVKAKYFAWKKDGQHVDERYDSWKQGKEIVLMTGAAYVNGWQGSEVPVGVTVDNGVIINHVYDNNIDSLVIIYATRGIAVSNIDNGDLYLDALRRKIDIRNTRDRHELLSWAIKENVSVFQTHLTIFKNQLVCNYSKSAKSSTRRFLVLVKSSNGEFFHVIFYFKHAYYTLCHISDMTLNYLKDKEMDVIAMLNLEAGTYDVTNTGGGVKDCNGDCIKGKRNEVLNLLTYYYE
jgi:hypothetical protein